MFTTSTNSPRRWFTTDRRRTTRKRWITCSPLRWKTLTSMHIYKGVHRAVCFRASPDVNQRRTQTAGRIPERWRSGWRMQMKLGLLFNNASVAAITDDNCSRVEFAECIRPARNAVSVADARCSVEWRIPEPGPSQTRLWTRSCIDSDDLGWHTANRFVIHYLINSTYRPCQGLRYYAFNLSN